MALEINHKFTSPKADGADPTNVQPSNWNDTHDIVADGGKVLGVPIGAAGDVVELPIAVDSTLQAMRPPVGTTGQRPPSPLGGMIRYNTTRSVLESYVTGSGWTPIHSSAVVDSTEPASPYEGMLWYDPDDKGFYVYDGTEFVTPRVNVVLETYSGDGSTKNFTLPSDPGFEENLNIFIDSDYVPKSDYSVSGTTLTFASAPAAGTDNIEVQYLTTLVSTTPSDGSVTTPKLADKAVTSAKIGTGAVKTANLNNNAVDTNKLKSGAVTFSKLSSAAYVTSTDELTAAAANDTSIPTGKAVTDYVSSAQAVLDIQATMAAGDAAPIGGIAFMFSNATGTVSYGEEVNGNQLFYCGIHGTNIGSSGSSGLGFYLGPLASGTRWRCLGAMTIGENGGAALYQRIE